MRSDFSYNHSTRHIFFFWEALLIWFILHHKHTNEGYLLSEIAIKITFIVGFFYCYWFVLFLDVYIYIYIFVACVHRFDKQEEWWRFFYYYLYSRVRYLCIFLFSFFFCYCNLSVHCVHDLLRCCLFKWNYRFWLPLGIFSIFIHAKLNKMHDNETVCRVIKKRI